MYTYSKENNVYPRDGLDFAAFILSGIFIFLKTAKIHITLVLYRHTMVGDLFLSRRAYLLDS